MSDFFYVGKELELFRNARNWKRYLSSLIRPYLHGRVLEVGAGTGTNTIYLCDEKYLEWVCLEPDAELATEISKLVTEGELPSFCSVVTGTIESLPADSRFDSILYIDVLEHIKDDSAELHQATKKLSVGGHLIIFSPAHNLLFSPFDETIGHYRRYNKFSLKSITPSNLHLERMIYVDAMGVLASLGNRLLLSQSIPKASQIHVWDTLMVPISRIVDHLLGFHIGKSILAVMTDYKNG